MCRLSAAQCSAYIFGQVSFQGTPRFHCDSGDGRGVIGHGAYCEGREARAGGGGVGNHIDAEGRQRGQDIGMIYGFEETGKIEYDEMKRKR